MKVQTSNTLVPTYRANTANLSSVQTGGEEPNSPEPPKDKLSVQEFAIRKGKAWANGIGTTSGYIGGTLGFIPGVYAGVMGGAVFGGLMGGGLGPILGSFSGGGFGHILGTSWRTMGTLAKAGLVVGGLSTGVGMFTAANATIGTAGKLVGFGAGYGVGLVQGAGNSITGDLGTKPKPKQNGSSIAREAAELGKFGTSVAGLTAAVGAISGGAGGAAMGAGVASTGSLIQGLMARNVTASSIFGSAATGALIGGALMFGVGAIGGWKLGAGAYKLADKAFQFGKDQVQNQQPPKNDDNKPAQ